MFKNVVLIYDKHIWLRFHIIGHLLLPYLVGNGKDIHNFEQI